MKFSLRISGSILFLFIAVLLASEGYGQTFTMTNGSVITCSGDFYDSGGQFSDYGDNESFVYTICPGISGGQIQVDFSSFDVDNTDELCVYNGNSTTASLIGCYNNATTLAGQSVQALNNNNSGCLTFEFTSDGFASFSGWQATIDCFYPCQEVEAVQSSSSPGLAPSGDVEVCKGDSVTFYGDANYPNNDSIYHQSDVTSSFIWDFEDGTQDTGQTVTHTFNNSGIYNVELTVIDSNGCESNNDTGRTVVVAPEPIYEGTGPQQDTICMGQTNTLVGQAVPDTIFESCTPPTGDTTVLPDIAGATFTSSVTVGCYGPGQTITSVSDIVDICLTIEHSYIGDLTITLTCPSGQTVTLADPNGSFAANTQYLGEPVDMNTGIPGVGYQYCFNDNPTYNTWINEVGNYTYTYVDALGNTVTNDYLPSGSYTSEQPLSNLLGCPMNGNWEISVTDHLFVDDGTLFEWSIDFDNSLLPGNYADTVEIDSTYWENDPAITYLSGNKDTAIVEPDSTGLNCFEYTSIDSFGCEYDTTVCFYVGDAQANIAPPDTLGCGVDEVTLDGSPSTGSNGAVNYNWSTGSDSATTSVSTQNHTLTVTDSLTGCPDDTTFTVPQWSDLEVDIDTVLGVTCNGDCDGEIQSDATGSHTPFTYQWNDPANQTSVDATGLCPGTYTVSVTDTTGCTLSDTATVINPAPVVIDVSPDTTICIDGNATISANASGGTPPYTYIWDQGLGTGQTHTVAPDTATNYAVYAQDANGCTSEWDTVRVEYFDSLEVGATGPGAICPDDTAQLIANASGGEGAPYDHTWSTGGKTPGETVTPTSTTSYSVTVEDACETPAVQDSVEVIVNPLPDVQISGRDLEGCKPVRATLINATPPADVGGDCVWDLGDGTQVVGCDSVTHLYDEPGCYDVTLTLRSREGCVDSVTRTDYVCVREIPEAEFTVEPPSSSVYDTDFSFRNRSIGASSYEWDIAGMKSSAREHTSFSFPDDDAGTYEVCLKARSSYDCRDTVCKDVTVQGEFILYVPNAFTPDGNGVNDRFGPVIQGNAKGQYRLTIYDRWGQVVFETNDPEERWDGTINGSGSSKSDVYAWQIVVRNKYTGKDIERTGQVTVVR